MKNIKRKIPIILFTLLLTSMIYLPFASASLVTIFNLSTDTSYSPHIESQYPSEDATISALGSAFIATNTGYLTSVNVWLTRVSTFTGTLQAVLHNVTGSVTEDTAVPMDNAILQVSNNVIYTQDVSTTRTVYTFTFNGTYQLQAGTSYALVIQCVQKVSGAGYILAGGSVTDTTNATGTTYHNGGWDYIYGTYDHSYMALQIYGDTEDQTPSPTPTPDPEATATPTPTTPAATADPQITQFIEDFISLIFPLILIAGIAILGAYFVGAWGFLAGLNIGIVLAYLWAGLPLWAVILIVIVDAVAFFSGKMGDFNRGN